MNSGRYGAIFDLDGTLVASEVLYQRATGAILKKVGRSLSELTPEEKALIPGRSAIQNMTFYVSRFELPWEPEFLVRKRMELVTALVNTEGVMLIPGAYELCQALRADGFGMAVASSSPRPYVRLVLETTGLCEHFDAVLSGDDVTRHKPEPDIFLAAAERIDVAKHRCVVFEDAHSGLTAAKAAGIKSILVNNDTILPEQKLNANLVVQHFCGLTTKDVKRVINGVIIVPD